MSAPQKGIQLSSPTRKPAYASAVATIMMSGEHRGNDRAFPAYVTNLHDLTQARSSLRCRGNHHDEKHGHIDGNLQILTLANHQKPLKESQCVRSCLANRQMTNLPAIIATVGSLACA